MNSRSRLGYDESTRSYSSWACVITAWKPTAICSVFTVRYRHQKLEEKVKEEENVPPLRFCDALAHGDKSI